MDPHKSELSQLEQFSFSQAGVFGTNNNLSSMVGMKNNLLLSKIEKNETYIEATIPKPKEGGVDSRSRK